MNLRPTVMIMTKRTGRPVGKPRQAASVTALHGGRPRPSGPTLPAADTEPPAYLQLSEPAAEFWRRHSPELIRTQMLTTIDAPAFGEMCECYAMLQESRRILARDGQITQGQRGPQRHPALLAYSVALNGFHALASRFGFTPDARMRLAGIGPKDDQYDDLISGPMTSRS